MSFVISCGSVEKIKTGVFFTVICYVLYINDISNVSQLLKVVLFADDTNILYSDADVHSLISIVNCELVKLYIWFNVNKLSLKQIVSKTNYMVFGNRRLNCDLDIKFTMTILLGSVRPNSLEF